MVGADPKLQTVGHVSRVVSPGTALHTPKQTSGAGSRRWRWIAVASFFGPLSLVLVQCGKAPNAGMLAANSQAAGDSFDERFPAPQFRDRFPTEKESLVQRQVALAPPE